MKFLTYCSVFVLLSLLSFPITAEAFSRRTHSSEVAQHQVQAPRDGKTETQNISPQAVPEPPVLLLLGIGIGLFAIYSMTKRFRGQAASREKRM
jgi:hypothetical protein